MYKHIVAGYTAPMT